MSEEFTLAEDTGNNATIALDDESATIALDADADSDDDSLNMTDEEISSGDDDDSEDDGVAPERATVVRVSEGSTIGVMTGMLIISFIAYAAAAAVVLYQISMYSTPGAFPWQTPMP